MIKRMVFGLFLSISCLGANSPYIYKYEGLFQNLYDAGRYHLIAKIIDKDDVILEAGGFDGGDTIHLVKLVPKGKVISFEPNPSRFQELVEKTESIPNVDAYPFALGEKNEMITFYVCYGQQNDPAFEGASSVLPPTETTKHNYQGPIIEVPCVVLDDWCEAHNEPKIDFMWLDLEGYELQVLKNSPRILKTVKAMYVETNFFRFREGMTQYRDLKTFLEKHGFKLLAHGYYERLQGNAVFVREDLYNEIVAKLVAKDR